MIVTEMKSSAKSRFGVAQSPKQAISGTELFVVCAERNFNIFAPEFQKIPPPI
jgi:hypothetical protein